MVSILESPSNAAACLGASRDLVRSFIEVGAENYYTSHWTINIVYEMTDKATLIGQLRRWENDRAIATSKDSYATNLLPAQAWLLRHKFC